MGTVLSHLSDLIIILIFAAIFFIGVLAANGSFDSWTNRYRVGGKPKIRRIKPKKGRSIATF